MGCRALSLEFMVAFPYLGEKWGSGAQGRRHQEIRSLRCLGFGISASDMDDFRLGMDNVGALRIRIGFSGILV